MRSSSSTYLKCVKKLLKIIFSIGFKVKLSPFSKVNNNLTNPYRKLVSNWAFSIMCGCVRVLRIGKPLRKSWQQRLFSSSSTPPPVQGVPYTKLSVGVPKEIWQDERRFVTTTNEYSELPVWLFASYFLDPATIYPNKTPSRESIHSFLHFFQLTVKCKFH